MQAVTAPGAGLAQVALLVMAVQVASAGVVVAVVMGLVVWGMSLPVVPAVMGCRWRGRSRWCGRPRWWWHSRVRRAGSSGGVGGDGGAGDAGAAASARRCQGHWLGWRCRRAGGVGVQPQLG
ncbi:hypothetical protein MMRN_46220 [Mycobacterium marinum]|nr:hypothetical protein MMRN_46220 [Mycobacterium marinum]